MGQATDMLKQMKVNYTTLPFADELLKLLAEKRKKAVSDALKAGDLRDKILDLYKPSYGEDDRYEKLAEILKIHVDRATSNPDEIEDISSCIKRICDLLLERAEAFNPVIKVIEGLESQVAALERIVTLAGLRRDENG